MSINSIAVKTYHQPKPAIKNLPPVGPVLKDSWHQGIHDEPHVHPPRYVPNVRLSVPTSVELVLKIHKLCHVLLVLYEQIRETHLGDDAMIRRTCIYFIELKGIILDKEFIRVGGYKRYTYSWAVVNAVKSSIEDDAKMAVPSFAFCFLGILYCLLREICILFHYQRYNIKS